MTDSSSTASPASFEGLSRIGQVRIAVRDVDRAVAFYRDTLGMPFLFQFPGMAFFDLNGTRLMLVDPESRDFGGKSVIYYRVGDIGQAHAALTERGVEFSDAAARRPFRRWPRAVDVLLQRPRWQRPGAHERGADRLGSGYNAPRRPLPRTRSPVRPQEVLRAPDGCEPEEASAIRPATAQAVLADPECARQRCQRLPGRLPALAGGGHRHRRPWRLMLTLPETLRLAFEKQFPVIGTVKFEVSATTVNSGFLNALVYGWLSNAAFAAILFILPRITGVRMKMEGIAWGAMWIWNLGVAGGMAAVYFPTFSGTGLLAEFPTAFDGLLLLGLLMVNGAFWRTLLASSPAPAVHQPLVLRPRAAGLHGSLRAEFGSPGRRLVDQPGRHRGGAGRRLRGADDLHLLGHRRGAGHALLRRAARHLQRPGQRRHGIRQLDPVGRAVGRVRRWARWSIRRCRTWSLHRQRGHHPAAGARSSWRWPRWP